MKEYIERAAVMESILGLTIVDTAVAQYADAVCYHLQNLPAADVAEVRHGRWLDVRGENSSLNWKCSLCTKRTLQKSPYCPNCGALMREVGNGEK